MVSAEPSTNGSCISPEANRSPTVFMPARRNSLMMISGVRPWAMAWSRSASMPLRSPSMMRCSSRRSTVHPDRSSVAATEDRSGWTVERRLEHRIIDGDRNGIEADLDQAMAQGLTPLIIINEFLLAGMKTVGERFASGEMQLPFVLGSAETMKTAVAYLEPYMEKADQGGKGTMVLATVRGDVHDIGKNLVDIILTNNGYTVRNLGI